ncbi:class I SAM-dependent methyltransferase [Sphingobacterium hungaricum]|uniref:Methyltransferase n=1 Tax=Sphingobacterium hungaricum TaxID=2082723 RepID=A0A928YQ49_9SPHI|nr:methyltransferase [Sphingobacterium hungaricum]MBE8713831.1 methyltransferase [Sphingobacterium hungaricum]
MEVRRKNFQGVWNIIRFNWHFYVFAIAAIALLWMSSTYFPPVLQTAVVVALFFGILTIISSLLVSYYVYDYSDLYELEFLENCRQQTILNVHAGLDETSELIRHQYPQAHLDVCDFYDPKKHTEISIKRARNAYPVAAGTIPIATSKLPFDDRRFDKSLNILAAHEIRNMQERIQFFMELGRVTKDDGIIYVTEHLRDLPNFLAYTLGFFHFHSRKTWLETFSRANLILVREIKTTPFITTFILQKNGIAL